MKKALYVIFVLLFMTFIITATERYSFKVEHGSITEAQTWAIAQKSFVMALLIVGVNLIIYLIFNRKKTDN